MKYKKKHQYLIFTNSDLKVGVGVPVCVGAEGNVGRPDSALLDTSRNGFGGGKNDGGSGGAIELTVEVSVEVSGLLQSTDFANVEVCDLLIVYS